MKDIKFYSWEDCPIGYRSFSPYTKFFFEKSEVLLVMVVINPDWNREAARTMLRLFAAQPTDEACGVLDQVQIKVFFWECEKT